MDMELLRAKIERGHYVSKLPLKTAAERAAYRLDQDHLKVAFKLDLLEALGLSNHPKANEFFRLAWEDGHANGFYEVSIVAENWAEVMR